MHLYVGKKTNFSRGVASVQTSSRQRTSLVFLLWKRRRIGANLISSTDLFFFVFLYGVLDRCYLPACQNSDSAFFSGSHQLQHVSPPYLTLLGAWLRTIMATPFVQLGLDLFKARACAQPRIPVWMLSHSCFHGPIHVCITFFSGYYSVACTCNCWSWRWSWWRWANVFSLLLFNLCERGPTTADLSLPPIASGT